MIKATIRPRLNITTRIIYPRTEDQPGGNAGLIFLCCLNIPIIFGTFLRAISVRYRRNRKIVNIIFKKVPHVIVKYSTHHYSVVSYRRPADMAAQQKLGILSEQRFRRHSGTSHYSAPPRHYLIKKGFTNEYFTND